MVVARCHERFSRKLRARHAMHFVTVPGSPWHVRSASFTLSPRRRPARWARTLNE
jgi:hypothetical protein